MGAELRRDADDAALRRPGPAARSGSLPLILAGGAAVGLVNGIGVALFGVPPIIMTLAANVILQGLLLVYTGGSPHATGARR